MFKRKCLPNSVVGVIKYFKIVVAIVYFPLSQIKKNIINNRNTLNKIHNTENKVDILSPHFINESQNIWWIPYYN